MGGTKGASIHLRGVAQGLARRGHQVQVLAARNESEADGFPVPVLEVGYDRLLKAVRQSIDREAGDPLLAREAQSLLLNIVAAEALEDLHRRWPIDAIYERLSLWSLAGLRFAEAKEIPFVLEVNAPLVREQRRYRELALECLALGVERILLKEADGIVVPAAELRDYVVQRVGRRRRVWVVPNGVDLRLFHDPDPVPEGVDEQLAGRYVIAFLGTLKPWHGIKVLLEAFERLRKSVPEAHLLVIGDGPMWDFLDKKRQEFGHSAMTLVGAVPHRQVPAWLARAQVGIAPYPALEDFYFSPLKVVEYLAAGLPVVASGIGQIKELVQDEKTGLLVPPGKVKPLVEALRRLHDRRFRERLGRRAARRARSRHGWEKVAEKIESLLRRCGKGRPPRSRRPRAVAGRSR